MYVTFEQAKLLKEKGFDEACYRTYNYNKELSPFPITENMGGEKVDPLNYKWNNSAIHPSNITAPEQHQVIEWLLLKHGIWIVVSISRYGVFYCNILQNQKTKNLDIPMTYEMICQLNDFNSPQETYSFAFDYILNNNLI